MLNSIDILRKFRKSGDPDSIPHTLLSKKAKAKVEIINRPNAKQVGTIFIKYSKVNQVRQLFDIAKISHYSMKT